MRGGGAPTVNTADVDTRQRSSLCVAMATVMPCSFILQGFFKGSFKDPSPGQGFSRDPSRIGRLIKDFFEGCLKGSSPTEGFGRDPSKIEVPVRDS